MATCLSLNSEELIKLAEELGVQVTPAFADKVGTLIDKSNTNGVVKSDKQYQKGYINDNLKESEFAIRDLAARLSARIGGEVEFVSDLTKDYSGYNEVNTSVINLAKATLDTPIHEIIGCPTIS